MKTVCVLGNGQLGRMLRQAGEPLGIKVYPVGLDVSPDSIPYEHSVITAEIERWPQTPFTTLLASHSDFVNRDVFAVIADRLTQKQLLDELGMPTSPWQLLDNENSWSSIFDKLGHTLIVKRRMGGYDGRGQWRVKKSQPINVDNDAYQAAIVEKAINFEGEVSLIGARNRDDKMVFYPLTHNLHQDGILKMSVTSAPNSVLQTQAQSMLSAIMTKLNYVGVMAMECFVVGDELLINELAPRVHNSGHWTQNGASISQFELHLRAILDLPLPKPEVYQPSVMINLIGTEYDKRWLNSPLANLHWYDKEVRAGRKVGHINFSHSHTEFIKKSIDAFKALLPDEYTQAIEWAKTQL